VSIEILLLLMSAVWRLLRRNSKAGVILVVAAAILGPVGYTAVAALSSGNALSSNAVSMICFKVIRDDLDSLPQPG
jgi:hypothetical protein